MNGETISASHSIPCFNICLYGQAPWAVSEFLLFFLPFLPYNIMKAVKAKTPYIHCVYWSYSVKRDYICIRCFPAHILHHGKLPSEHLDTSEPPAKCILLITLGIHLKYITREPLIRWMDTPSAEATAIFIVASLLNEDWKWWGGGGGERGVLNFRKGDILYSIQNNIPAACHAQY